MLALTIAMTLPLILLPYILLLMGRWPWPRMPRPNCGAAPERWSPCESLAAAGRTSRSCNFSNGEIRKSTYSFRTRGVSFTTTADNKVHDGAVAPPEWQWSGTTQVPYNGWRSAVRRTSGLSPTPEYMSLASSSNTLRHPTPECPDDALVDLQPFHPRIRAYSCCCLCAFALDKGVKSNK